MQVRSTSSENTLESIEQAIKEESQLLGPDGYPFRVTNAQAFIIGLAYTVVSLSGIPASGASINPARSFGPAFILNRWDRHWIYWVGPILGAIIAGLIYEFIFRPKRENINHSRLTTTSEPPYQMLGRKTLSSSIGLKETRYCHYWNSLLVECIATGLYVFIVCSTRISWTGSLIGHEPSLVAMALSSGIAMIILMFAFRSVHVNPAITLAFLVTGRISLTRAVSYVIAHCFGAVAATAFLYSVSIEGHAGALGLDNPHHQLNSWQILVVESVISFIVTITIFATSNYSSYANARKFILSQLNCNEPSFLNYTKSPYLHTLQFADTTSATNDNIRSRRIMAPYKISQQQAPISIVNTSHRPIINNERNSNMTSSRYLTLANENNKNSIININSVAPCSEYYSQVYSDYTDPHNMTSINQNSENQFFNIDLGYNNNNTSRSLAAEQQMALRFANNA